MLARLKTLIDQYNKKVSIMIDTKDNKDKVIIDIMKEYNINNSILTDDFDSTHVIIIKYQDPTSIMNFINEQLEKSKKIILIVKKDFNFSDFISTIIAKTIDAIILKDSNEYIISISKN